MGGERERDGLLHTGGIGEARDDKREDSKGVISLCGFRSCTTSKVPKWIKLDERKRDDDNDGRGNTPLL